MTVIHASSLFESRRKKINMLKGFVKKSTLADCVINLRWLRDVIATAPESDLTNLVFLARTLETEMQNRFGKWTTY